LALKRAESTRERLVEAGLELKRVEVSSHGENNPVIPTADNVAEPKNRRVEVTIR
jgi:outer membrane protein OmpA-like peptidoglycan-associated protein